MSTTQTEAANQNLSQAQAIVRDTWEQLRREGAPVELLNEIAQASQALAAIDCRR